MNWRISAAALALLAFPVAAQTGKAPAQPPNHANVEWPTYNGDYSGRRFSSLSQINANNVHSLTLAWAVDLKSSQIKATPLVVNGVMYVAGMDHAWAVDARTGSRIWHWTTKTRGGTHIGNRGMAIYKNWVYLVTPDNYLVSLDATTGKERWRVEIADLKMDFFSTVAPIIIRNHVIVSPSIESTDNRGYIDSYDPETGKLQWRLYTTPDPGAPGSETWPNNDAQAHGGAPVWIPGTYDPELNLYYFGTGNPMPVMAGQGRRGADLWTDSIIAINPDTGKMVWYYQTTPDDIHDWDAAETPVLFDATINGHPRKLLAQANRNGYYFVLDRTNGEHIATAAFVPNTWAKGLDKLGRPIMDPKSAASVAGTLVFPSEEGGTNWFPPSFDPQTKLFYVRAQESAAVYYLTDTSAKPEAWGGIDKLVWHPPSSILALDATTGKKVWRKQYGGWSGMLTTAGKLLFTGDGSNNVLALDPANGNVLWHVNLGDTMSNGPMTYQLDGRQYVVVAVQTKLFAFALPQ